MKSLSKSLLLVLLFSCTATLATIRTVNNNSPSPGQYSTFDAAVTAAAPGDTLYISGSATSYGFQNVSKPLTIIGTGFNPDKQNPLLSSFATIYFFAGSNGSRVIGLTFSSKSVITTANSTINYEYCSFSASLSAVEIGAANITLNFRKCVFYIPGVRINSAAATAGTANFYNCVFNNAINDYTVSGVTLTGTVNNCLFVGGTQIAGGNLLNFTFSNSIFYETFPQLNGTKTNVLFQNNLSYAAINNNFGGNANVNNLVNVNPLFVSYTAPPGFKYTDNFHLQAASPAKNYGTDGTDLGIYGGADPYFHMGGEPFIPQIRQMNINSTTVPVGQNVTGTVITTIKQ